MRQSEEHNFEQAWKKALGDAIEPPPSELWAKIEAQLPDPTRKSGVLPLWKPSTLFWSLATGIAAALVVGLWLMPADEVPSAEQNFGQLAEPSAGVEVQAAPSPPIQSGQERVAKVTGSTVSSAVAARSEVVEPSSPTVSSEEVADLPATEQIVGRPSTLLAQMEKSQKTEQLVVLSATQSPRSLSMRLPSSSQVQSLVGPSPVRFSTRIGEPLIPSRRVSLPAESLVADAHPRTRNPAELLNTVAKSARKQEVSELSMDELLPTPRKKSFWAGVAFLPGWFNPRVALRSPTMASSSESLSGAMSLPPVKEQRSVLEGNNTARFSYAVQGQIGKKLSKHWSLETGLSYLEGQSAFSHPGFWQDPAANQFYVANYDLLESALIKSNKNVFRVSSAPETVQVVDEDLFARISTMYQQTPNDYRFLQVPIQLGYDIAPSHRLSYTLLAGIVGNLFLQNTIETERGEVLTTRAQDGVYSAIHAGGIAGLRLNYSLSPTLTATLTGSYQQALSRAAQEESALTAQPQLYGVGWGVRYQF